MKYEVAIVLILAAVVSAQWHLGGVGHSAVGHAGHVSGGSLAAGHHSRWGRSLAVAPLVHAPVGHVGLVGAHGLGYGGWAHHRLGRSVLLSPHVVGTGLVHTGVWNHGLVSHHGLLY